MELLEELEEMLGQYVDSQGIELSSKQVETICGLIGEHAAAKQCEFLCRIGIEDEAKRAKIKTYGYRVQLTLPVSIYDLGVRVVIPNLLTGERHEFSPSKVFETISSGYDEFIQHHYRDNSKFVTEDGRGIDFRVNLIDSLAKDRVRILNTLKPFNEDMAGELNG